jgi:cysteine desulfurase
MSTVPVDRPIYLDHNATTPLLGEVVDAMLPYLREHFGNPSSGHAYGRRAHEGVEEARARVAELIDASPDEIIFTSGGTEANNLALRGVAARAQKPGHLITSIVEHPAVARPCDYLEKKGWRVDRLPVDSHGQLDVDAFEHAYGPETTLITIMHSNNETGVLQPVRECAQIARGHSTRSPRTAIHTDAAQSVGKVDVDVDELGVDLLTIAGHKLYAPKGIGALYVRRGTPIAPVLLGAGHEAGLRPGTENVASIVGLGAACEIATRTLTEERERQRGLRDHLWALLQQEVADIALNGHPTARLPNTLNVRFPNVSGNAVLAEVTEIAASTGSACHEGGAEVASAVITALGVSEEAALGSVRLSLGRATTADDVEQTATALSKAWSQVV